MAGGTQQRTKPSRTGKPLCPVKRRTTRHGKDFDYDRALNEALPKRAAHSKQLYAACSVRLQVIA
jgi:hypothetical protein